MDCDVINKHFNLIFLCFLFHLSSKRLNFELTFREKPNRESILWHQIVLGQGVWMCRVRGFLFIWRYRQAESFNSDKALKLSPSQKCLVEPFIENE